MVSDCRYTKEEADDNLSPVPHYQEIDLKWLNQKNQKVTKKNYLGFWRSSQPSCFIEKETETQGEEDNCSGSHSQPAAGLWRDRRPLSGAGPSRS